MEGRCPSMELANSEFACCVASRLHAVSRSTACQFDVVDTGQRLVL